LLNSAPNFEIEKTSKPDFWAIVTIVITNALPVLGVAFLGWSPLAAVALYIIETIIIGIFHFLKMLVFSFYYRVKVEGSALFSVGLSFFFLIHFFAFVGIQTIFVFAFAEAFHMEHVTSAFNFVKNFTPYFYPPYLVSVLAFVVAQFRLASREMLHDEIYKTLPLPHYMFLPYSRIFIQQFLVIVGAYVLFTTKSMLFFVLLLGLLKAIAEYLGLRKGQEWLVKTIKDEEKKSPFSRS